jgi:formate C-acetyltransferase
MIDRPILAFPPEAWATTGPDARAAAIMARLRGTERRVDVERARYATQSYRATEGQPMPLRRARMLLDLVRQMSIAIHPDELIVGNRTPLPRMGVIAPEGAVAWVDRELDVLPTRPQDRFDVGPEVVRELREEVFPQWRGHTLEDAVAARIPEDVRRAVSGKAFSLNQTDHAQGHILPDVEGWLRLGVGGLRQEVEAARARSAAADQQAVFYDAALFALQAASEFMARYADLAERLASGEAGLALAGRRDDVIPSSPCRGRRVPRQGTPDCHPERVNHSRSVAANDQRRISSWEFLGSDPAHDGTSLTPASEESPSPSPYERTAELRGIADRCRWLSERPPRNFPEALQAVWFLFVLLQIESNASSFSPGRLDQYLLPFLEADLAAGRLTLPQAQSWLELLWLKFNEIVLLRSSASARYFAGFPIGFNVMIGGQRPDGTDAANPLSYMCLRAQADLGLPQPNLSLRIHRDSPEDFLRTAAHVISRGSGMPQVFNDEVIIPGQLRRGIAPADALNYAVVGCVELSTPGKALAWSDSAMFNMARILELTLFGGRDPHTGEQIGLATPPLDRMATFAELDAAYDAQLAHFVGLMVRGCDVVDAIHAELLPSPFLSLVVQDCIERGVDVTAGGAHYNFSGPQGVQIANVADSLAAVRQAVFEEGWLPASALLEHLRNDFDTAEPLRQRLIRRVPKYGNDDERVDALAQRWGDRYCELVAQHPTIRGGAYQPGFYTVSAHVPMGANVGALPDGRHAGEPLADGGLSPMTGRDRLGPTAVLRSVSRLNLALASNGTLLNMKFLPSFFRTEDALAKFVLLLRGFCALRVPHVQFNVVSAETLRRAQARPEEFRNLVVRVAGYSAYFTELDRTLQDEIIARTGFDDAL